MKENLTVESHQKMHSFLVSLLINGMVLLVLWLYKLPIPGFDQFLALESIVDFQERDLDELTMKLDNQKEPAETLNLVTGNTSRLVGGNEKPLNERFFIADRKPNDDSTEIFDPETLTIEAMDRLEDAIGQESVTGDVGAVVDGYGPALDRLTQELIRLMRREKLLVVWLFDESNSMKDDQEKIKTRIGRVYRELKVVNKNPQILEDLDLAKTTDSNGEHDFLSQAMLTAITSFGKDFHIHSNRPTSDLGKILPAIDSIPVDLEGRELMCRALSMAISKYQPEAKRDHRRLVLVLVSDESGDDAKQGVETVIRSAKQARAPIYILGREAVFGSPYAYVQWSDPQTRFVHFLPINRGPESAYPEVLMFNGYRRRSETTMSGFGPYDQIRLVRETGGIFFQLPNDEENLVIFRKKRYQPQDLRAYVPDLSSRSQYVRERDRSHFRKAIYNVVMMLDPSQKSHRWMELPSPQWSSEWMSTDPGKYGPQVSKRIKLVFKIVKELDKAIHILDDVRNLREEEKSVRWRANYDLIFAQLHWYKVKLFSYAIRLDNIARNELEKAVGKNSQWNAWHLVEFGSGFVAPEKHQEMQFRITEAELRKMYDESQSLLKSVIDKHPETPWAEKAIGELRRQPGLEFRLFRKRILSGNRRGSGGKSITPVAPPKL